MFHKRKFIPLNPQKYSGDPANIIMRSSWETKFAIWCDRNPSIVSWNSEETIVPYVSPVDNRVHRYFIDFKVKIRDKNNNVKTYLVEIKPDMQTRPPVAQKKTKKYLQEVMTWGVNESKWKAAHEYAENRGWQFIVLTEKDLGI
jgi:CRISPR/Cas system CMR-associated protein Cmr5 small subunit